MTALHGRLVCYLPVAYRVCQPGHVVHPVAVVALDEGGEPVPVCRLVAGCEEPSREFPEDRLDFRVVAVAGLLVPGVEGPDRGEHRKAVRLPAHHVPVHPHPVVGALRSFDVGPEEHSGVGADPAPRNGEGPAEHAEPARSHVVGPGQADRSRGGCRRRNRRGGWAGRRRRDRGGGWAGGSRRDRRGGCLGRRRRSSGASRRGHRGGWGRRGGLGRRCGLGRSGGRGNGGRGLFGGGPAGRRRRGCI